MESKSLRTIITLEHLAFTLCKIIKVISAVIGCITLVCLVGYIASPDGTAIGSKAVDFIDAGDSSRAEVISYAVSIIIISVGTFIVMHKCVLYFAYGIAAGTPFTKPFADRTKVLGIYLIVVPAMVTILCAASEAVIMKLMNEKSDFNPEINFSVGIGIMLLIMSVVFRYGADLRDKLKEEKSEKQE